MEYCFSLALFSALWSFYPVVMVSLAELASMKKPFKVLIVVLSHELGGSLFILAFGAHTSFLSCGFIPLSLVFDLNADELTWLILSALPVCLIGLAEDLGYNMSPKLRLVASMRSPASFVLMFLKFGCPNWEFLVLIFYCFSPFAILFTIFATVGVVNAFNLIDGLNGLSSYVSISVATSLSIIAFQVGNFN